MRREIPEEKKRFAVARILSGRSSAAEEAKRLGVSSQAVRAWVRELRPGMTVPDPARPSPSLEAESGTVVGRAPPKNSGNNPAPGAEAPPVQDPLARARAAAGIPQAGAAAAPPLPNAEALKAAEDADRELVLKTAFDAKAGVMQLLSSRAGLPPEDPDVKKISGLTPIAATALAANAGWIAPIIREKVQGKLALVVALGIEAFATLSAFKEILRARGLLKEKEPEEKKPEEKKP